MKIKFLATGNSPDKYSFNLETVTAYQGELSEDFDLTNLEHGDAWQTEDSSPVVQPEVISVHGNEIIPKAYRDENGELWVTLCQKCPLYGDWRGSDWVDSSEYDETKTYIKLLVNGQLVDVNPPVFEEEEM